LIDDLSEIHGAENLARRGTGFPAGKRGAFPAGWLLCLLFLAALAIADFSLLGLVRRTFVFYSGIDGSTAVEDRMLKRSPSRELDITRYVEEALLGPVSPGLAPLFPLETRLRSLLYRDGVVYADLSEPAALPLPGGGDAFRSLRTLYGGIRRNFPYIKEVKIFIAGNEVRISGREG
jgi:hypothetical protein